MEADRVGLKPFLLSLGALTAAEATGNLVVASGVLPQMPALGLTRIAEVGLFLFIFHIWGDGLRSLGLGPRQIRPGLQSGLIWSLVFGGAVLVGFGVIYLTGRNPLLLFRARLPENGHDLALFLVIGGLIGPITEEVFFRGILYGRLRRLGIPAAVLISSAIFILAHPSAGFTQSVGGILFALAYERAGWLMTPITIHVLGNLAIFGLSMMVG
jgi:hypothetical protein